MGADILDSLREAEEELDRICSDLDKLAEKFSDIRAEAEMSVDDGWPFNEDENEVVY